MHSYRILICDDDALVRELLRESLSSVRGFNFDFVECDRLAAAIGILEQNNIDLVFFDLKLPDNFGLDAVADLRTASPHAAIVVLSGFGFINDAIRAVRLGADDYRVKPPEDPERLAWIVALTVERKRQEKERVKAGTMIVPQRWVVRHKKVILAVLATLTALAGLLVALLQAIR